MARKRQSVVVLFLVTTTCLWPVTSVAAQTWRGLTVAPESRCSRYESSDYSYPQSVELRVIDSLGGVWSPYTGQSFRNRRQTDIEHIVARSEAHDSGLCAADRTTQRRFASDPLAVTLASPRVNQQKGAFDAAEWLPTINRCWFADRVVLIRRKYHLTIDRREAEALERVFDSCTSLVLVRENARVTETEAFNDRSVELPADIAQWDDNGNGRITCAEARAHGIAPVPRNHPAYPYMNDRDNDGMVCE